MDPVDTQHRTPLNVRRGRIVLVFYNKPAFCGGTCLYCIQEQGFTKSTISNEDTLLAKNCNWDPTCQIDTRFNKYQLSRGHGFKYGLAVKGDSFTNHDPAYLVWYFKALYDYLNGSVSESFEEARARQREASDRCVAVQIETRPDQITLEWCDIMARLGVTSVEIGVQSLDDKVLEINRRGHGVEVVRRATRMLREYGFDVGYHMMMGLVGSSDELDYEILSQRLWEPEFCPDRLKIYPCLLLKNIRLQPQLSRFVGNPNWKPLDDERYLRLLRAAFIHVPSTVLVNRIQRLVPPEDIMLGPTKVIERKDFDGISRCLFQRSIAQKADCVESDFNSYRISTKPHGTGYCIEAAIQNGDIVLGFGRLEGVGEKIGMIRDLRVMGNMVPVGEKSRTSPQHIGIGKAILKEMERIAREREYVKLLVHPPVGALGYFERLGFQAGKEHYLQKSVDPLPSL